jgi:hypothetical protein
LTYLFWEYDFNTSDNFESIILIQCKQCQVKLSKLPSIKQSNLTGKIMV